jgi:hypothetical protein
MSLARDLELVGDIAAAEHLLRKAKETSAQVRGIRNPRTLFGDANLALLLRARGETEQAAELTSQTIPALKEILGAEHPEVVMAEEGEFIEFEMDIPDR